MCVRVRLTIWGEGGEGSEEEEREGIRKSRQAGWETGNVVREEGGEEGEGGGRGERRERGGGEETRRRVSNHSCTHKDEKIIPGKETRL